MLVRREGSLEGAEEVGGGNRWGAGRKEDAVWDGRRRREKGESVRVRVKEGG